MKIAHVFASIEPTGGDRISYHHIKGLIDLGHTVEVWFTDKFKDYWKDREFSDPDMAKHMWNYKAIKDLGTKDFSQFDMIISNGLFGSFRASQIDHPLKVWFCQNLDKYVFHHVPDNDKTQIDQLYKDQNNYMSYSDDLLQLIDHYYGKKKNVLCTNGITYREFLPFQKQGKAGKRVCFMSAYNGILKRTKFANMVFGELNRRGFTTVEINAHHQCLVNATEFYHNPTFQKKCEVVSDCDVMLHTSSFETWGLVPMESMALGVPVVGSDSKGITIYADSSNSVIINEYNVKIFCDAIEELVNDQALYRKLQQNGINTAKKYDWDDVISDIENSYLEWLK